MTQQWETFQLRQVNKHSHMTFLHLSRPLSFEQGKYSAPTVTFNPSDYSHEWLVGDYIEIDVNGARNCDFGTIKSGMLRFKSHGTWKPTTEERAVLRRWQEEVSPRQEQEMIERANGYQNQINYRK